MIIPNKMERVIILITTVVIITIILDELRSEFPSNGFIPIVLLSRCITI